ncbi:AraC family transcriptional regulator [Microbacterium protaetiae]|uniref:AraC family transcriptional regulator n=1 Tax=Microbacterium protaetiae TaxID=2509458 RepID=A0A4P6EH52_9MICO|nr:AraC family transcriptional regulator [Microbacterium protaetiae]
MLRVSNFRGVLGARIEAGSSWQVSVQEYPGMAMHAVLAGNAWLTTGDRTPLHLATGDVVMTPARVPHHITDRPEDDTGEPTVFPPDGARRALTVGAGPTLTRILTVFYDCDHATRTQVVDEMSGFIHIVGGEGGAAYLDDIVTLLGRELDQPQLATTAVIDGLIDIVLICMVRAWIALRPSGRRGTWLGWADDPVVEKAVTLIHRDPAFDWTTSSLAAATSVSRATLSRRFAAAMGLSPADYIAQWRMDVAAVRLRDTSDSVEKVAAAVGYRSVPSFTRAFARDRGRTPGAYRSHAVESRATPRSIRTRYH